MDFQQSYLQSLATRLAGSTDVALMGIAGPAAAGFRADVGRLVSLALAADRDLPNMEQALCACSAALDAGLLKQAEPAARRDVEALLGALARTMSRLSRGPRSIGPLRDSATLGRRQRYGRRRYKPAV